MQSRYDKEGPGGGAAAYVNCPMSRDQYEAFIDALLAAEKTEFREFEGTPYFDGCLPIEVMAERGRETLRHGPMKPVGLTNAHSPAIKPYAVVQLRQDNALGTLFNIVGFQTKLRYGEQGRVFRMIPGLENAEFARLGGMHRNTYLNSPRLLDQNVAPEGARRRCASPARSPAARAMSRAPRSASSRAGWPRPSVSSQTFEPPPPTTAIGALLNHITGGHIESIDAGSALFPADERQLWSVSADRRAADRRDGRTSSRPGAGPRAQARPVGAGEGRFGNLDRGGRERGKAAFAERAGLGMRSALW